MTDEKLGHDLGEWMKEAEFAPPDSRRSARQVATRLPQTRQLGRWWWLPSLNRKAATPVTADHTTDYQPTSTPAANGHSPTVTGRTQSMFSPVKAITAGALVFAIGGVLLIAQPFDQQGGSVPGAARDEERAAPDEFTGQWTFAPGVGSETEERGDDWERTLAVYGINAQLMTDPRFDGEVTVAMNWDDIHPNTSESFDIRKSVYRVENEEGAWQSDTVVSVDFPDVSSSKRTLVFHGERAYDGLTAIVEMDTGGVDSLRGVIINFDVPDPEPESLQ